MNKRITILAALVTIFVCVAMFSLSAYAAPEETQTPVETNPPVETPTETEYVEPPTETPVAPTEAPPATEYTPTEPVTISPTTDDFYYFDADAAVNQYDGSAGSISDYTTLYDTSDFDESALEKTEWDNIELDITQNENADAADFSAIKNDKSTEDDSHWMLYLGWGLIILSAIGILYFIIALVVYKKGLRTLKAREQSQRRNSSNRSRTCTNRTAPSAPAKKPDYSSYHRYNRYSDTSYASRKSSKADTAEINLKR